MGWDVKATADAFADAMPPMPSLSSVDLSANSILLVVLAIGLTVVLVRLLPRLWASIEATMFTNWRLALLGSAAFLLSLAGGWTTWDGMRNFTGESVLSAMFTFGIHGVMLIVAWLIGESFATGMNQVAGRHGRRVNPPMVALTIVGILLLVAAGVTYVATVGPSSDTVMSSAALAGAGLLALALLVMFSKSDVIQPYAQGARIVAKNAMLWVMFVACMATSVFFSFDSRFNVIFPKDQRERAAEIRTKKQVAAVVADIGDTIGTRRIAEAEKLFVSDGWKAYETQLASLSKASEGAEAEIEAHFTRQMEAHRSSIAEQQERIATAVSGQAGLASKKTTLTDELSRLKADRPTLAAELATKKGELDGRAKEVDAKRVEAMAEDKGVEGSLKAGRGPIYRERMGELDRLKEYYKIGEERVRDAQKRLDAVDTRVASIERELAGVDGELAKARGEAETAEQRIKAAEESHVGREGLKVDPARVRAAFETARAEFRQKPDVEHLSSLHQQCAQLYDAMISAAATKDRVRDIDCDPKQASEAAAVLFGLNAGHRAFENNCAGGDRLPDQGGVDALLGFGRKCLQDSGLPSKDSTTVAAQLGNIDLNRDDKAHNFVVSLNAFEDGNRLAYLALAIAIGIDSLIFMTGLFGANAVRSPLSDVPSNKARNSQQLDAMIETALLPDTFKKARLVAGAMHPIENVEGFSNEVRLDELDPETAMQVRDVLNAGAIIGAVRQADRRGRYLVRSELLEFLNTVIKRELETNGDDARQAMRIDQLEEQLTVAMMPDVAVTCDRVLQSLQPINATSDGYMSAVYLNDVDDAHRPAMLNVLNTGAIYQVVKWEKEDLYYVRNSLYQTLSRIRAREMMRLGNSPRLPAAERARFGGALSAAAPRQARLTDQSRAAKPLAARNAVQPPDDASVRDRYLAVLLEALDIDPAHYAAIPHDAFAAAVAASEAFVRARLSHPALDSRLSDREDDARSSLDVAFTRLENAIRPDDAWMRQRLADAAQEIEANWQVLMLLPRGPFENVLRAAIEQLEPDAGAGELTAEEAQFYNAARRLYDALERNPRTSETAWESLGNLFGVAGRTSTSVAAGDTSKRHLN